MEITIRAAILTDVDSISTIGTAVWLDTYAVRGMTPEIASYVANKFSRQSIEAIIHDQNVHVLVAEMDKHLIGYGVLSQASHCPCDTSLETELSTLYVLSRFRGCGVGKALYMACQNHVSRHLNRSQFWLRMNSKNLDALAFYKARGLVKIGSIWLDFDGESNENFILVSP